VSFLSYRTTLSGRRPLWTGGVMSHRLKVPSPDLAYMKEQQEIIALTPSQLAEVCVQFASEMAWIGRPGGTDWYVRMKCEGSPEVFHDTIMTAMCAALQRAASQNNTELGSLREFKHEWETANG
jgi:hypothetical protein